MIDDNYDLNTLSSYTMVAYVLFCIGFFYVSYTMLKEHKENYEEKP